jgi:hypothetical protein
MSQTTHKDCYGSVFPDTLERSAAGKVFAVEHPHPVGGVGRLRATIRSSDEQWADCTRCDEFDHCYAYSTAKLLMEAAVCQA